MPADSISTTVTAAHAFTPGQRVNTAVSVSHSFDTGNKYAALDTEVRVTNSFESYSGEIANGRYRR